jgi:hypothetical protein
MKHPLHVYLVAQGFEHKLIGTTHHEYTHPDLPGLHTYIADYDSYAAQKAIAHAINKLKGQEHGALD